MTLKTNTICALIFELCTEHRSGTEISDHFIALKTSSGFLYIKLIKRECLSRMYN